MYGSSPPPGYARSAADRARSGAVEPPARMVFWQDNTTLWLSLMFAVCVAGGGVDHATGAITLGGWLLSSAVALMMITFYALYRAGTSHNG